MKYLLSFNESYKEDKASAFKSVRKKYEDIITEYLLYLSDNYNTLSKNWNVDDHLVIEFFVDNDNKENILESLKSSIDKLEHHKYNYLDDYKILIGTTPERFMINNHYNYVTVIYLDELENLINKLSPINTIKFIIINPK